MAPCPGRTDCGSRPGGERGRYRHSEGSVVAVGGRIARLVYGRQAEQRPQLGDVLVGLDLEALGAAEQAEILAAVEGAVGADQPIGGKATLSSPVLTTLEELAEEVERTYTAGAWVELWSMACQPQLS